MFIVWLVDLLCEKQLDTDDLSELYNQTEDCKAVMLG